MENLSAAQIAAVAHIRTDAIGLRDKAVETLNHIMRMSNVDETVLADVRDAIRNHARIAVHFHPDRPIGNGLVVDGLLQDGIYKNQFETRISNGLVAPNAGGHRDQWEQRLFGMAYNGTELATRPKYGALDLTLASDGPAPRFGSCYFILKEHVSHRATFTFGGSQDEPSARGTVDEFDAILAALLEESFTDDTALGMRNVRPATVLSVLQRLKMPQGSGAEKSHNLDHLIEAQVHGSIRLDRDVAALVADGSFASGAVGDSLRKMGAKFGFETTFNCGYELPVELVPKDFRGPRMPDIARMVGGIVTAKNIGNLAQNLPGDVTVQDLKLLWHILVRFG